MKLYRVHQHLRRGFDTFSEMVVAAPNETAARMMHPYGGHISDWESSCWPTEEEIDAVEAEYLGEAAPNFEPGVIVASFTPDSSQ